MSTTDFPLQQIRPGRFLITVLALWPTTILATETDLISIFQLAEKDDPTYQQAKANFDADRQVYKQVRASRLPSISASANYSRHDFESNIWTRKYRSKGYTLSLKQPLVDIGLLAAYGESKAQYRRAKAIYMTARHDLILRTVQHYFDVLLGQDTVTQAQAAEKAINRQLTVAQNRLDAGLGTLTDVHDSRARFEIAQTETLEAQSQLNDAIEALYGITGQRAHQLKKLIPDVPAIRPDPDDQQQWVDRSLQHNYELRTAEAEVIIAKRKLLAARSRHFPVLNLVGSHRYSNSVNSATGDAEQSKDTSVGIEMTLPIFQGGALFAGDKEARHRYNAALQNAKKIRRSTERNARSAYEGIISGIKRIRALKQAVIASESALFAKRAGFDAGIGTNLDVLDAQRELYRTKRDYARARYSYLINLISLKRAGGILGNEDLLYINGLLK